MKYRDVAYITLFTIRVSYFFVTPKSLTAVTISDAAHAILMNKIDFVFSSFGLTR